MVPVPARVDLVGWYRRFAPVERFNLAGLDADSTRGHDPAATIPARLSHSEPDRRTSRKDRKEVSPVRCGFEQNQLRAAKIARDKHLSQAK